MRLFYLKKFSVSCNQFRPSDIKVVTQPLCVLFKYSYLIEPLIMKNSNLTNTLIGLTVLASSAIATNAYAETGLYLGASASQAFVNERGLDDDDTGGKVFAGYNFNNYVGIEGSYYDFGEISNGNSELAIDGVSLAVVGSLPLSARVSLFGKVGAHDWDTEATGPIASQLTTDGDTDAFYGIGVNYKLNSNWDIRGEVERYEVQDIDMDVVSLGVSYNF
ncbi:MAG: OOP family OmpA-OmpF porin [Cryomorphaceae bacterium]|jgi:OOP family OmpA-OmpF porin